MATVLNSFKPDSWRTTLLDAMSDKLVHAQAGIVNRDFEGEVHIGNTVRSFSLNPVSIGTYDPNVDMGAPETLSTTSRTVSIDQIKDYHFYLDDVDRTALLIQTILEDAADSAADGLAETADTFVRDKMIAGAGIFGAQVDGPGLTAANVYNYFIKLRTRFTRLKVPEAGRYAIVPPEVYALLLDSNRMIEATGPVGPIQNAVVGQMATFTIIESNRVSFVDTADPDTNPDTYKVLAGVPQATTYADDLQESEAYRPERRFGTAVKGLHVYGAQVFRPELLAVSNVTLG